MQTRGDIRIFIVARSTAHDRPCPLAFPRNPRGQERPRLLDRQTRPLRLRDILPKSRPCGQRSACLPHAAENRQRSAVVLWMSLMCAQMDDGVGKGPNGSGYWTEVTRYWGGVVYAVKR